MLRNMKCEKYFLFVDFVGVLGVSFIWNQLNQQKPKL